MVDPITQPKTWEMSLITEPSVAGTGTEPSEQGCKTVNLRFLLFSERGEKKKRVPLFKIH